MTGGRGAPDARPAHGWAGEPPTVPGETLTHGSTTPIRTARPAGPAGPGPIGTARPVAPTTRPASADAASRPARPSPARRGRVAQRERSPCGMTLAALFLALIATPADVSLRRTAAANPSCSTSTPTRARPASAMRPAIDAARRGRIPDPARSTATSDEASAKKYGVTGRPDLHRRRRRGRSPLGRDRGLPARRRNSPRSTARPRPRSASPRTRTRGLAPARGRRRRATTTRTPPRTPATRPRTTGRAKAARPTRSPGRPSSASG